MNKEEIIQKLRKKGTRILNKSLFNDDKELFRVPVGCQIKEYDWVWCNMCDRYEIAHGEYSDHISKEVDENTLIYRSYELYND